MEALDVTTVKEAVRTLRSNLVEVFHGLVDSVPDSWPATDLYLTVRRRLSATPLRFVPSSPGDAPRSGLWLERKIAFPGQRLVIDAFPGSGNSFASNTVRDAADLPPAAITSHFHRRAQIQRAVALGLPTVVIVRHPHDACRSLKSKQPELSTALILGRWIHYHSVVERYRDRVSILLFRDLVSDLETLARLPPVAGVLQGRPLRADPRLERRAPRHVPLDLGKPWNRALLRRAERLYARFDPTADPA